MKKAVILTSLSTMLLLMFLHTGSRRLAEASATTWHVPSDFPTIQGAIDAATPYDTIQVAGGIYYEHLSINKDNLTIIGENPSNTVIDGNGTGNVISLNANNVTITGFTVRNGTCGLNMMYAANCTIIGNIITSNENDGLFVWNESNNNTISNNIISMNEIYGLRATLSTSRNVLSDNLLMENKIGLLISNSKDYVLRSNNMTGNLYNFGVWGSSPIEFLHDIDLSNVVDEKPIYYLIDQRDLTIEPSTFPNLGYMALVNSQNVTVRNLSLTNNYQGILSANTTDSVIEGVTVSDNLYGIHLDFSTRIEVSNNLIAPSIEGATAIYMSRSKYNTLVNNKLDSCYNGIYLIDHSADNAIFNNKVSNGQCGIRLEVYSSDNVIYHNTFINNTQHATTMFHSYSIWDDGYPSGGNYWSDYEDKYPDAEELDGSGIWDTPYAINGGDQDTYPLMKPLVMPDLNKDGIVDILDVAIVGKAYGSTSGDSNWNLDCDVDYNGRIDVFDLATVARNYGKTF